MIADALNDDAGRAAYLAAFHATQALIFERTGKVFKTRGAFLVLQNLTFVSNAPHHAAASLKRLYRKRARRGYRAPPRLFHRRAPDTALTFSFQIRLNGGRTC
jgi:hypothetical protein